MDQRRFDTWTKALAEAVASRRWLLTAGPGLGVLAQGWGEEAAARCVKPGRNCQNQGSKRERCCGKARCKRGTCRCRGACSGGQFDAKCRCRCPANQQRCDRRCRDLSVDARHCGRCGNRCTVDDPLLKPACEAGTCGVVCRHTCPNVAGCADLTSDLDNCGACDNACALCTGPKLPACVDGDCVCLGTLQVGDACDPDDPAACISGECGCTGNPDNGLCVCREPGCRNDGTNCETTFQCCQGVCGGVPDPSTCRR